MIFISGNYINELPSFVFRKSVSLNAVFSKRLVKMDDATCNLDLRSPPGNHFEKPSGSLQGKS